MVDNFLADLVRDYWEIISACAALLIMMIRMESSIRSNRTLTDEKIRNLKELMHVTTNNLENKVEQSIELISRDLTKMSAAMDSHAKAQERHMRSVTESLERIWKSLYHEKT